MIKLNNYDEHQSVSPGIFLVPPGPDDEPLAAQIARALNERRSAPDSLPLLTDVAQGDPGCSTGCGGALPGGCSNRNCARSMRFMPPSPA